MKINFYKKISKGNLLNIIKISVVVIISYLLLSPINHLRLGNVFFGNYESLYNIKFSRLFFTYASYPIIGKPPIYAHYQLSRTYFIEGDLKTALSEVKKELEFYPENMRAYYMLGLTLGYMNKEEEAIDAFSKFIEWNPTSWAARNDKAWLQFRIGDISGAIETIKPVIDKKDNPWVQNTYGTLLMNKKNYSEAKNAFLNAKQSLEKLGEGHWGQAYPGNDPRIYSIGLDSMKKSIEENILLLKDLQNK